ncbi:serpin family protein [Stigmatella aurantiaca]|uniref:Serpin n=1 Tax=Stigmatella aurantiaca (strain DW4/3-1) TaxID=378806 RepID=Q08S80_STIAD|nr:serpin family protein [Stigmatella aurantiaca]ADO72252.1 Serpin (Serine proteinase inhibitor) family protein [Stigmatella aurantiaca DW4/3-1]EAU63340.1 serpin [Stigmatella aurantiaca DW4/3-1]
MTSSRRWLVPLFTAAMALAHCADAEKQEQEQEQEQEQPRTESPDGTNAPGEYVSSGKERVTSPNVPSQDIAALVTGNTDFGASLYRKIAKPGENLFFSPFSISQALSMVYTGARGNTEAEMAETLHFSLPQARLHPAANALNLKLQAQAEETVGGVGTPTFLRLVNATWSQQGFSFEPAFLDVLALHYGNGMRVVDFSTQASAIRDGINTWVKDQTEGRIQDLLPPDGVNRNTRLLLVNALYFKGAWASPFAPQATQNAPFYLLNGGTQQVQMMNRTGSVEYMQGEGFEAVGLPYQKNTYRMLLIVPQQGRFAEIESRLSAGFLSEIRGALVNRFVALGFPRFQVEKSFSLADSLQALGMTDAFSEWANFSGLTTQEALAIARVEHKAFVAVDEKGTEAAAATAVIVAPPSVPEPLTVNRPFLFLIEDKETKTVLFLGRFVKP